MIAGTRQSTSNNKAYRKDPLYAYAKLFTEAASSILATENYDIFTEPQRAIRSQSVREELKNFFCENFVDENDPTKTAEEIEDAKEEIEEQFENDMQGVQENAFMSEYAPMVGMALPIHKLILMNNVFAQGNGIQRVTAVQPSFTISLERRFLVTPDGQEIDLFLHQNQVADAIDSTVPTVKIDMPLPQTGGASATDVDVIATLGGTTADELSTETHVCGIYVENVYIAEGDRLPDADGWYSNKGEVATADQAGLYNVWFPVKIDFVPGYGGPGKLERVLSKPITIVYKTNAAGDTTTIADTLFGSMDNSKISLTSLKGQITTVKLAAKLNSSSANMDFCSVKWKIDSDYVEIPEATPVNTTISPEEVKDVAAMYDANQVTKIMSITKTVLSEYKDMKIKRFLDADYQRLDERTSFYAEVPWSPDEGYALDFVTWRQATFMDYFDDLVTRMLQVLNDPNMTVSVFGDPRIIRKITPTEYTYQAPANIGPVTLDYTQTIVNTKDQRVYNFVGSDKFRNTNELMVLLNPRNTERICYRLYDYQLYISNEIRNASNVSLPSIHSFERFLVKSYQPVQARIHIVGANGYKNRPATF